MPLIDQKVLRQAMEKAGLDPTNAELREIFVNVLQEKEIPAAVSRAAEAAAAMTGKDLLHAYYAGRPASAPVQPQPVSDQNEHADKSGLEMLEAYYRASAEGGEKK